MGNYRMRRVSEDLYIRLVMAPTANITDGVFPSSSTYINVATWARFAFLIAVGTSNDTSVTAKVVQATATAGTGSKDVSGAALTATSLAGTDPNKWAIIEVDNEHLDIANDFNFAAISVAATGGSATIGAIYFLGIEPRVKPPTFGTDLAEQVFVDG